MQCGLAAERKGQKLQVKCRNEEEDMSGEKDLSGKKGIHLTVVTPEEDFYDGMAESILIRTVDGYMGFLQGRSPVCALLHDEGKLRFREPGSSDFVEAFLSGGFAFMDEPGGDMTIYTDSARWPDETSKSESETKLYTKK